MQPPDTEPATAPSARMAIMAPGGRGDEPQVRATVSSTAAWPASSQDWAVCSTYRSAACMAMLLMP